MLTVIVLFIVMLRVIMLNVVMLSVIMLNDVILSVVAPFCQLEHLHLGVFQWQHLSISSRIVKSCIK
jgi:hypothetical protein